MREEYYVENDKESFVISADVVNKISGYLIAKTETNNELKDLAVNKFKEQQARTRALLLAYKECPNPIGTVPASYRQNIIEKRNELVEKYYKQLMDMYK